MKSQVNKPTIILTDHWVIKYHADGIHPWSKGQIIEGLAEGYWEWYRLNGTIKRSGYFLKGVPVGLWVTYDQQGKPYKRTERKK